MYFQKRNAGRELTPSPRSSQNASYANFAFWGFSEVPLSPGPMPQGQPALSFVDNGGRHPRVPRSPPGSYHFPSRPLSNHKTLYENHSFSVYPLALPIRAPAGLSRVQSKPLPGRARISYPPARPDLFSPNVVEQAFSEVRQESSKGTIIWLLLSRMPSEIPLPRAARLFYWYRAGPMPQGIFYVQISVVYIRKHNAHRDMTPPPSVLVLSGRGYAELRHNGVLGR
jgi:hypothetical protein